MDGEEYDPKVSQSEAAILDLVFHLQTGSRLCEFFAGHFEAEEGSKELAAYFQDMHESHLAMIGEAMGKLEQRSQISNSATSDLGDLISRFVERVIMRNNPKFTKKGPPPPPKKAALSGSD